MHHVRGNIDWRGVSFLCARKGGYEDLTRKILHHFESSVFVVNPVTLQCDKKMRIIDVCRKVARERKAVTVLLLAPKTSHQSKGSVEAVQGQLQGLARCYQTSIETNIGLQLSTTTQAHEQIGSVAAGGDEALCQMNTWWVRSLVCLNADEFAQNRLENSGAVAKRARHVARSGILMLKGTLGCQHCSNYHAIPLSRPPRHGSSESKPRGTRSSRESTQDQNILV